MEPCCQTRRAEIRAAVSGSEKQPRRRTLQTRDSGVPLKTICAMLGHAIGDDHHPLSGSPKSENLKQAGDLLASKYYRLAEK